MRDLLIGRLADMLIGRLADMLIWYMGYKLCGSGNIRKTVDLLIVRNLIESMSTKNV